MTTYRIAWGRGHGGATISTADELDHVLDTITTSPDGLPYSVAILIPDGTDDPTMLEIGIGHPDRSFAFYSHGDDDAAWAHQPELPPIDGLTIDYGGQATDLWPERTRVSTTAARAAARQFVTTDGRRPTNLMWDDDPN